MEPSAASSVDLNTSLSVCSNLYLVWLIDDFHVVVHELKLQWVGDCCPSRYLFESGCRVLLSLVIQKPCLIGLCCHLLCPDIAYAHYCLSK